MEALAEESKTDEKPAKAKKSKTVEADNAEEVKMVKVRAVFAEGKFGFDNTRQVRIYDGDEFEIEETRVSKIWMKVI